jgi:hypothetical protein
MTETDEPAVLFTQRMRVASRKAHSVSDSLVHVLPSKGSEYVECSLH